jgi:superoxide dismutase, Fe-Mn family
MFTLPELSYAYDSLAPHIDARTMEIHHTKHHQSYIDKLNAALEEHADLAELSVEELLRDIRTLPESVQKAVQNHGGGHANHTLFWEVLTPGGSAISDQESLSTEIDQTFGSFDAFKEKFAAAAAGQFGSGWGWLVVTVDGDLEIIATANQDSPLMQGKTPIFGVDVWEHAYYLEYQNRRPDYLSAVWDVVNWKAVEARLLAARAA